MKAKQQPTKGFKLSREETDFYKPQSTPQGKRIKKELDILRKYLIMWNVARRGDYYPSKESFLIKEYLAAQYQYYEEDQFNQNLTLLKKIDEHNLYLIESEKIILKSYNLFPHTIWPIRYHNKFISKIQGLKNSNEILYVMAQVDYLACGVFNNSSLRPIGTRPISFNRFFAYKLVKQKNLIIQIGVQKVPIIKNGLIRRYEFTQYMHILDILPDNLLQTQNKLQEKMKYFIDITNEDVSKKDHSQQLQIDRQKFTQKNYLHQKKHYFFEETFNAYSEKYQYNQSKLQTQNTTYYPIPFKPSYVSNAESTILSYNKELKRWVSHDYLSVLERKKLFYYQKQIRDAMVKQFIDFQSAKTLVQLLTKIPNFKVNLTEQEKDVIGQNGNVLAIGRSGTGKTTCAVLRLFSIEMLFKIRYSLNKKKYQSTIEGVRCGSDDIENATGLHCIFLTASPVLTHQIQRYYKKLTDNIKIELQKKKKKIQEQRKKNQQEQKLNQSSVVQQEIQEQNNTDKLEIPTKLQNKKSAEQLEQQKQIQEQFSGLQLKQDIKNEQFKQQEQEQDIDDLKNKFQQNSKKFYNLFDLRESDYPGFFTVRNFIMMIDGCLVRPFFIRSKENSTGGQAKASWHNEKKGVMMIENYFRDESEDKQQVNLENIEEEFNYSDQEELQHEYLRQIQLKQNKDKQQLTKKLQKNKIGIASYSFQIDYDYFVVHFWPRVVKKYYSSSRNITPHLVWTQIYSTIKGSSQSHRYPSSYLSQSAYTSSSSNSFLTQQQKLDIYETFCQYERWKINRNGYDIMDAVNYILNSINTRGYQGPEIHYVMIDEVQDLPHSIVYLLSKMAIYGVFYSGDTAQTIAKGVGFRFSDLRALFSGTQLQPITKHLTINFRSHNNILQLANSIISSLEILFPKTIDRLKKEVSDLAGPKPMILSSNDQDLLFYVLCGQNKSLQQENGMKKPPLEFGCDQVIIVRDQESKAKIPAMLQHALCLTIYEAKGLQFNDVILFNFFQESPCPEKWNLLKSLGIATVQVSKQDYQKNLSRHKQQAQKLQKLKEKERKRKNEDQDQEDENEQSNVYSNKLQQQIIQEQKKIQQKRFEQEVEVQQFFNRQKNVYQIKKLINTNKIFKDINDYSQLCSQLKLLYTAITRPKKTLIIYDNGQAPARRSIQKLWSGLNVIEIITKQIVVNSVEQKSNISQEVKIFKTIVTATDKSQWKKQGLKMYSRGYFDQAMKCFEKSGHQELYKKAEANKLADQATKKLIQIQSQRNMIKQGNKNTKESNIQISKSKKKFKADQSVSFKKFLNAGKIFQSLNLFKQAGQCFFSGKSYEKAFQLFCKADMAKQAAQSLEMQQKYRQAAEYYQKADNYLKVVECLDMVNDWVLILQKIQKYSHKMVQYEKQALLKKYSALALEQLVYQIQFENEEQNNKPENNRVQVIEEKDSDEQEEYDSQQDSDLQAERQQQGGPQQQSKKPQEKQQSKEEKGLIDIKESVYQQLGQNNAQQSSHEKQQESMSFSALNNSEAQQTQKQVSKNQQGGMKSIDQSFGDLNRSQQPIILDQKEEKLDIQSIESSFSDLNAKYQNELEPDLQSIRSMVDPEDTWIKNSISQITHKLHSQYSVIDDDQSYNINVKIIKTKGNIFVQDQIMRRIVNIVSIINSSVNQFFKQFKGYQSLITANTNQKEQMIDNRPQISQFQDIDPKFINIILDTLESFKLFKLCLFVCNRYHLPSKAGRYLISLGMKYSTNSISNNVVNPILLSPSSYRKLEIQKGILASIAIHAIYENVNSEFLKVKVTNNDDENKQTLGTYFIEGLILEGLYKKAVFMVNPQESLKILYNFNDYEAFNNIFKQKILKDNNQDSFGFLQRIKTRQEIQYTKILLKKIIFQYSVVKRFESISSRYYKQFQSKGQINAQKRLEIFKIPDYLPFTKLITTELNSDSFMNRFKLMIGKGYKILTQEGSLQNLDFVCTMLAIIYNQQMQIALIEIFNNDQFLEFYRCSNHIKNLLCKINLKNSLSIIEAVLNMHQCYLINYCKSMSFVNDTFCFVSRISTVANELVENQKTNNGKFAFFFEQDYNLILTKTSRAIKIVSKKYQGMLNKLFEKRLQFTRNNSVIFYEDLIQKEEELVIKKALSCKINCSKSKDNKKKKVQIQKKTKQLKVNIDFKSRGDFIKMQQSSDSEQQQQQYVDKQIQFYKYNTNPKLTYLSSPMTYWFNQQFRHGKDIADGKYLYGCGLSSSYREYVQKIGGFNLFDALEFYKFKRIDLFAENILSVYNKLALYTRQNLLPQILTLLLVQYKAFQEPKGFCIKVTTNSLKYLQKLRFIEIKAKSQEKVDINGNKTIKLHLQNNEECKFSYINRYVSQMNKRDLTSIICDFLELLQDEGYSQFFNYWEIILMYVINIGKDNQINQSIRNVLKFFGIQQKNQSLHYLISTKNLTEFQSKKKELFKLPNKIKEVLHDIVVDNKGDLQIAIEDSQFDYQVQGRILKGRAKAVAKIQKWWKAKRIQLKQKRGNAQNYFQLAVSPSNLAEAKNPLTLADIRLIKAIHHNNKNIQDIDLLIKTEKAKTQLLSFYLTNTITSSLDFHFILMNLNKIEECRKHYFQYCSQDIDQLHQFDIDQIHNQIQDMLSIIQVWKNDQKWLREKKFNLKKKKVFEVKWMTKNLGFNSILKKRAGLKKQSLLQQKKKILKNK